MYVRIRLAELRPRIFLSIPVTVYSHQVDVLGVVMYAYILSIPN